MRLRSSISLMLFTALPAAAGEIDFNRDIRPILTNHCTACHGGVKQAGEISFVIRDKALAKGKSGLPAIVPGKPEASELIARITSKDPDTVMPQPEHGPPLPAADIEKLRQWIAQGAQWKEHWAFVPPIDHPIPQTRRKDWSNQAIDRFVLAGLEAAGAEPNPEAEPALLLRRLSIDLIGLPPTLAELDAFEAAWKQNPDTAWQREIDRLLASHHYGERWATTWLDLARYGDTEGLGHDQPRPAWPYRDWVIRAYNDDLPFDQFTIKQLAGDLLPNPTLDDLIATNFHRQSPNNSEGGTDDEEFRITSVMDRVATTWEAWQGVTIACVQCHSHPYDPIQHEEYYTTFAFFNNARDHDLQEHYPVLPIPKQDDMKDEFAGWWNERKTLLQELYNHQHALRSETTWHAANTMQAQSEQVAMQTNPGDKNPEFRVTGTASTGTTINLQLTPPADLTELTALRLEILPLNPDTAIHTPEWGAVLSQIELHATRDGKETPVVIDRIVGDEPDPFHDPQRSLDKDPQGWGIYTKIDRPRSCILLFKTPIAASALRLNFSHRLNAALSIPLVSKRGRVWFSNDPRWTAFANDPAVATRQARIAAIDAEFSKHSALRLPILEPVTPALERSTRVFHRGNWLDKDQQSLNPQIPALFGKLPTKAPADRLALAQWLVSKDNPLAARVAVNRLWEQLFGLGLVETLEDFGSAGTKPSHPELLDHLALRYRDTHRWSQKAMLREIVSSATYRQSAIANRPVHASDPHNRLLARGPRVRLSAEAVRDHALVATNLLAPKLFGPPVFPPMPEGGWTPFESKEKWITPAPGEPDRYRRSIYTYLKHTNPYPSFTSFDAPSRERCTTRRILSNTPLQALDTLNSPAYAEFTSTLARRISTEFPGDLATKIATAYRATTSRQPDPQRLERLLTLHRNAPSPEQGFNVVASVLLNLDEALVK